MSKLTRPLAARVHNLTPRNYPASDELTDATIQGAIQALADGKTKYTNRPGIVPLREWVASYLNARYDIGLSADDITITCGVTEARFVAITYLAYNGKVTLSEGLTDPAAWHGTADVAYLAQLDDKAQTHLDEVGAEQHLIWDMSVGKADFHPAQHADLKPRTISIGGIDGLGAGWRIGWLAGHAEHARLRSYKQSMTICTPSVSQWATLAMLEAN